LTAAAFRSLTCTPTTVIVGSVSYYQCGPTWYQRAYSGGSTTYVVINAPAGY
jgi:cysteinyl-tRNA synthetase